MPRHPTENATLNPWVLVGLGFAALAISFSVRAMLGLAMPAIESDLGWTRSFLSSVGALALLLMGLAAPFAGRVIDQSGPRLLIAGGMAAVAIGACVVAVTDSAAVFTIGFGIIAAVGFTAVGTNVIAAAIAKSFDEGRGLATGIGTSGATAGQLCVVPLAAALMQSVSWRYGYGALAVCALVLAIAAFVLLPRKAASSAHAVQRVSIARGTWALMKVPAFHVLFWSFFICGFTTSGVIETHFLPYASFCGFPPLPSATAYGVLSAVNLAGMVLAGHLTDRVHRPLLLGSIYIIRALSFILLLYVAPDIRLLYLFVVLFGLVDYSTLPVTVGLAVSHLGVERIGLAMGLIAGGHALGGAAGALAGGLLFDASGAYAWLWIGSIALSLFAGLLVFTLRDRPVSPEAILPSSGTAVPAE